MTDREITKYMNEFYAWREREFGTTCEDGSNQHLIAYKVRYFIVITAMQVK